MEIRSLEQRKPFNATVKALSNKFSQTLMKLAVLVTIQNKVLDIEKMVLACPKITSLCVYMNKKISYWFLSKLSKLEHLEIRLRNSVELTEVIDYCRKLKTLVVYTNSKKLYEMKKLCHVIELNGKLPKLKVKVRLLLSEFELVRYQL